MRVEAYEALFRTELDAEVMKTIRAATNRSEVMGSDRFHEDIAAMLGRKVSPPIMNDRPLSDGKMEAVGEQRELGL